MTVAVNMARVLALSLALSAAFACSSNDNSRAEVEDTAVSFYSALSDDPPRAYELLAAGCHEQLSLQDFSSQTAQYEGFLAEDDALRLQEFKVVEQFHNHMTADYDLVLDSGDDLPEGLDRTEPSGFVKEDGSWRLEDCGGFATRSATETPSATPTFEPGSAAAIEADPAPTLPGEFVDLQEIYGGFWGNREGTNTASHRNERIDYTVQGPLPPGGGPHWGAGPCPPDPEAAPLFCGPVPWGVYRQPFFAESVVHNMEHAGVVVWYNTSDTDLIADLEALVELNLNDERRIVMMPYPDLEPETIALTAWARRDRFSIGDYSPERVQAFIGALECRFDPEALCAPRPLDVPLSDDIV